MEKNRLEAFSDGVLSIIFTIMVLELKVPHSDELAALEPVVPVFLSYVLSFIYVGIYWNNHHHMFRKGLERQAFTPALLCGNTAGIRESVDFHRPVCAGSDALVCPRPPD